MICQPQYVETEALIMSGSVTAGGFLAPNLKATACQSTGMISSKNTPVEVVGPAGMADVLGVPVAELGAQWGQG